MIRKSAYRVFRKMMLKHTASSSNPAAGRNAGKMPVMSRKDGRHPKYDNHGRIAGRCFDQRPAILRMVFVFGTARSFVNR